MGGIKRKLPMEKIQKKESRAVAFSKRRTGLYSKASELCLLSDAQIAILTTPCSSNSNASFYSFGHSSVDAVVSAFLSDQRPVREDEENLGLGFWWEEERLAKSENVEELRDAIDSMSKMLRTLKESRLYSVNNYQRDHQDDVMNNDIKKKDLVAQETQKLDQTLDLQSASAIFDDLPANSNKTEDHDQILASSETLCITDIPTGNLEGYTNEALDLDQLIDFGTNFESPKLDQTLNLQSTSANSNKIADEQDQIVASSETLCITDIPTGNLYGYSNEELDLDQLIDFGTNFESPFDETLLMEDYSMDLWSDSQGIEDGALMFSQRNEDDLLQ